MVGVEGWIVVVELFWNLLPTKPARGRAAAQRHNWSRPLNARSSGCLTWEPLTVDALGGTSKTKRGRFGKYEWPEHARCKASRRVADQDGRKANPGALETEHARGRKAKAVRAALVGRNAPCGDVCDEDRTGRLAAPCIRHRVAPVGKMTRPVGVRRMSNA